MSDDQTGKASFIACHVCWVSTNGPASGGEKGGLIFSFVVAFSVTLLCGRQKSKAKLIF